MPQLCPIDAQALLSRLILLLFPIDQHRTQEVEETQEYDREPHGLLARPPIGTGPDRVHRMMRFRKTLRHAANWFQENSCSANA
jgi:hypothetical protein